MKITWRMYLVSMRTSGKNGASRSYRLLALHNRTFRDTRTYVLPPLHRSTS